MTAPATPAQLATPQLTTPAHHDRGYFWASGPPLSATIMEGPRR
jgi:hypothetical protein